MLSFNIGLNKIKIPELAADKNDIYFNSMKYQEFIGGNIPTLEVSIDLTDKDSCPLNIGDEISYEISINEKQRSGNAYLYSINKRTNSCVFKFFCVNSYFIRCVYSNISYKNYKDALESCLPFPISDDSPETPLGDMEIHRFDETNYTFFNKLIVGYKDNCIYGIKSGSVIIRDVNDWNITDEKAQKLAYLDDLKPIKETELSNNKYYDYSDTTINVNDDKRSAIKFGNAISFCNKEFEDFYRSAMLNSALSVPRVLVNGTVEGRKSFDIGDCVMISGLSIPQEKFFVNSFMMHMERSGQVGINYSFASYE